ncbi:MAG: leucyl aminopeptidase [Candidatus Marinimicrobia bacterium]|nr:leucyl aminopeptidase [Candidatus Neomarinimicrobiota bacterium]MBL7023440.1 leucyl aminopeptidase [Candidatus Neomarinimicrobiota bacterium]MBL7108811.1 leucyl aminopeptidase [Candidatus Neomarinimicrobiota bacterium]
MAQIKELKNIRKDINEVHTDLLIVGSVKTKKFSNPLKSSLGKTLSNAIKVEKFTGKLGKSVKIYGDDKIKRIAVFGLGETKKYDSHTARDLGAKIIKYANSLETKMLTIDTSSMGLSSDDDLGAFAEGLVIGSYEFLDYKSDKKEVAKSSNTIVKAEFIGANSSVLQKAFVLAEGVAIARDVSNHPANIANPTYLANTVKDIAKADNMKYKVFDGSEFEKMGMGAFYGVARGATTPAKMIIVEYNGGKKAEKPFALVGKGLTFDSGGISLKPGANMDEMKFDMCGSAVVIGVLKAVAKLQPKINIIFAIGSTENMPDGDAQRPGDIVTAYNGKTIEILNTDAEGRLVLADVLAYVTDKYKPVGMLDFATLTGAVLIALGNRASGLMGNDTKLIKDVKKSSETTGEKVWELPLWDEYSKEIKGKYADLKNMGEGRLAGTIAAGIFLKEFVGETPWCHLDIAGTAWGPKEPSYQPKVGATGVAVRLVYNLLENRIK